MTGRELWVFTIIAGGEINVEAAIVANAERRAENCKAHIRRNRNGTK